LQDNDVGYVVEIIAVTYHYFQILLKLAEGTGFLLVSSDCSSVVLGSYYDRAL
jgi:hypothetical protein